MSQPGNLRPDVRLWRIEHPDDGIGPFNSMTLDWSQERPYLYDGWEYTLRETEGLFDQWLRHPKDMPTPMCDTLLRPGCLGQYDRWESTPSYKFAYPDRQTLLKWWCGRALRDIAAMGYVVQLVGVPWEAHTRWREQARYDSARATTLEVLSPVDVLWH